jgi:hypothetical protein
MKKLRFCFLVFFCLGLLVPAALHFSGWIEKTISFENKQAAKLPEFKLSFLDPFPSAYESYFNDHFPARNSMVFQYNYVSARYLGKSPKPEMFSVGKSGWLYMANNEENIYTGNLRFSDSELKKSLREIEFRQKKCQELGAEYRIVIVPSKFSVYPEYLPEGLSKYPGSNAVDQLMTYLRDHSTVRVLDLRPELRACKTYGQLYTKGDNHWNGLGVFCAYRALVKWLAVDYKIPPPLNFNEVSVYDTLIYGGNIIRMLGMGAVWKDLYTKVRPLKPLPQINVAAKGYPCPTAFGYCSEYEVQRKNRDTTLPAVFVVRESFTNPFFRDLLSAHFGRSTYIWDKWEHRLNLDLVRKEKPKIVLCIVIESMIDCFESYPDGPSEEKKE